MRSALSSVIAKRRFSEYAKVVNSYLLSVQVHTQSIIPVPPQSVAAQVYEANVSGDGAITGVSTVTLHNAQDVQQVSV